MISASHNLYDDNGIKFFDGCGSKLSDEVEEEIERELENLVVTRESRALGRATRIDKSRTVYQEFCASTMPKGMDLRGLKIVIDCANGAATRSARESWRISVPRSFRSAARRMAATSISTADQRRRSCSA